MDSEDNIIRERERKRERSEGEGWVLDWEIVSCWRDKKRP